jgi:hypothetical protein
MVHHFINVSTIQIKKENPTAAAHGGKVHIPPWPTVLPERYAAAWR